MNKVEIGDIQRRVDRTDGNVMAIGTGTLKKLIAHVRRLEKVRDAVYECDAGNHYVTGLPLHEKLLEALKAIEEAEGEK